MKSIVRVVALLALAAALPLAAQQPVNINNAPFQVKILGNSGNIFDAAGDNVAAPGSEVIIGGIVNTSTPTYTNGNVARLQLDASGNLKVNCTGCSSASSVNLTGATSGGLTMSHLVTAATNNATSLKASAGQLYGASVYNNAAYPVYLKFSNIASAPTCGTTSVVYEVAAQAGTEREVHTDVGLAFSTGIGYCVTKGIADADNTSVAASDATIDLIYK